MTNAALDSALQDLWQHVTSDRQAWLFGAGISYEAGIPLMVPLTAYVRDRIREVGGPAHAMLGSLIDQLPEGCHVEHVLSQLGDLIALADRSRDQVAQLGGRMVAAAELRELHAAIVDHIGHAVRYGYRPARGRELEQRGTQEDPIVEVDGHREFVRRLFSARVRPGVGQRPITFFTTNYDTLLEDALALERVPCADGFSGGAMAFWAPQVAFSIEGPSRAAKVVKLHGSVDWHRMDDGSLVRCRSGCRYPNRAGNLMIYPQSTKYVATQRDPFASLFAEFRAALAIGPDNVLGVCGYSFGDDHVNDEIETAMGRPGSRTVLIAFAGEGGDADGHGLPLQLARWLGERAWSDRVFAVSGRGLRHGSLTNLMPEGRPRDWWTFSGLARFLAEGPEYVPASPAPPGDTEVAASPAAAEDAR